MCFLSSVFFTLNVSWGHFHFISSSFLHLTQLCVIFCFGLWSRLFFHFIIFIDIQQHKKKIHTFSPIRNQYPILISTRVSHFKKWHKGFYICDTATAAVQCVYYSILEMAYHTFMYGFFAFAVSPIVPKQIFSPLTSGNITQQHSHM